jgi:hypothetical protein
MPLDWLWSKIASMVMINSAYKSLKPSIITSRLRRKDSRKTREQYNTCWIREVRKFLFILVSVLINHFPESQPPPIDVDENQSCEESLKSQDCDEEYLVSEECEIASVTENDPAYRSLYSMGDSTFKKE